MRSFGCLCYPNLSAKAPNKLSPWIFIGYPPEHKGYGCLDLATSKIITSRHVIFDELTFPLAKQDHPFNRPQTTPPACNPGIAVKLLPCDHEVKGSIPLSHTFSSAAHNNSHLTCCSLSMHIAQARGLPYQLDFMVGLAERGSSSMVRILYKWTWYNSHAWQVLPSSIIGGSYESSWDMR
jgi:hypothetical protein